MNAGVLDVVRQKVRILGDTGEISEARRRTFRLYDDGQLVVLANTNASYGYLYLLAVDHREPLGADAEIYRILDDAHASEDAEGHRFGDYRDIR